ncbi:Utp12 domain-containing protein [Mycena kentingensis (nom. inval.)]|nr:Utp12 domain-containing protein [Mycena kentingensis (nom. inval.)]
MAPSEKSKKSRTKPPTGRPQSTAAISQPVVEDASQLSSLCAFSPDGSSFAFLSLAIDKHRLRVYDTTTNQSIAEHILDSARVSSLTWGNFDPSEVQAAQPPSKKKRRKSQADEDGPLQASLVEVVMLGLSDGSVAFFSPTHGRILRTLSHSTSTAAILSVVSSDAASTTWTSGADGAIRIWNPRKSEVLGSWKNGDGVPYSSVALRPTNEEDRVDILVANHSLRLLAASSESMTDNPSQLATFTGHASSIKQLKWDASQLPSTRFVSLAEGDRTVSIWETPETSVSEGKMVASVQLDADARSISLSLPSPPTSSSVRQHLLALTASGKISIYPMPPASSSRAQQHKVSTLLPRSTLSLSVKKSSAGSHPIAAAFAAGVSGNVRVARVVGGARPVFDLVQYLDDTGDYIPDVVIEEVNASLLSESQEGNLIPNKRYTEARSTVRSGVELGLDETMDDMAANAIDGDLDVEIAELSLGQRLTALSGDAPPGSSSDSENEGSSKKKPKAKGDAAQNGGAVPANSLTRTLIQALHSSDTRLLETCLAHSDQTLIRNTVRRLPPQLAVPLITACVDRLGRGARAANMKGSGGGASSQRGTTLIVWVKTVLTIHSGHLMTMPDLVARLAGLHATVSSRLALQENLLSLSGRLDMVLSQIEMRSSAAPAPLAPRKGTQASRGAGKNITRYVEGESADEDDEDEQMDVQVEVDSGDEDGSIEDVELGGDSSEDEGSDEGEDSEDDDGDMNGFIDDEAEEVDSEEDDDDNCFRSAKP